MVFWGFFITIFWNSGTFVLFIYIALALRFSGEAFYGFNLKQLMLKWPSPQQATSKVL
jgi:predicted MFS family arabinose efflux permease